MRKNARPDEEFVKDAIIRYTGTSSAIRGEDPPDYYIRVDSNKIALEVTTAPALGNRTTSDVSLVRLCNKLDNEFRNLIGIGVSVLLKISSPIGRPRTFAKRLRELISNCLSNNLLGQEWESFLINGESVGLKIINHSFTNRKRIVGLIMGKGLPLVPIQIQLDEMVTKSLRGKSQKLAKIKEEKWIGLLNDTILADENNFRLSIENINFNHDFSKIFLVGLDGNVNQIFSA